MPRGKATTFRARASQLGSYLACDYRAAFDRAIEEGLFALPEDQQEEVEELKSSSMYADFGTCVHFHMQDGMRCQFPGKPADHAPDEEQRLSAALMHGGDMEACDLAIRLCATLAATHMPKAPDNKPWFAEWAGKCKYLQGHIDFLSQDYDHIVDLKTTSRPPDHYRPKPEHLVQLCAYYLLVKEVTGVAPSKGTLLYVDSRGSWALPIHIDFTAEHMQEYIGHVREYAQYLRSPLLMKMAIPRLGKHCSDGWCPYRSICKDAILPGAAKLLGGEQMVQPKMDIVGVL